jgi:hypothetical protein
MTICYPVSYEIVDMARFVLRQIRMIPPSLVGTLTVTKFGNVVTRGTNNVIRLNDNIVVGIPLTQEEKEEINGL